VVGFNVAGTNLKVGGSGPERKWGHRYGAKRRKNFCWSCPLHFLALKAQLVVLVSAFVMVNTFWSVSCLLFFYSRREARAPVPHGVGATGNTRTFYLSVANRSPNDRKFYQKQRLLQYFLVPASITSFLIDVIHC